MGYLSNAGLSYFFGKLKTIFAPISHGHGGATQSAAGFMSAADKKKLDGIAEGANKYSLPTATSNVLGGVKTGANITNSSGVLSVTAANVTNALGYTPPKQDTNTWRPVVNSLTNSATDQSLAANQGKILNESKAAMIVLTNENLNDVVTPGFYSSGGGNNVTNKPSNVDNFGLIVIHQASGNYYTQIVYSDSAAYRRHCVNGTWSGWVQDKLTDTDTWRGIQNNLTSDSTTDSLSAAQGKALKTLVDGKAAMGHTHNSIKDIGNKSSDTTFAYSKAGMSYTDYTWLAGWNGYELRAVNKGQFATAGHTHDASVLINNLSIGDSTPQDDDYYVSQYAGGGTTSTTYYRRPVKALWSYIKGKGDAIYQPKGSYAAASHTHTKAQVGLDNVDNTADANKSVKYATKAANADVAIGVADYNTPSKTIKIGYNGDGITGDAIKYIAGYTTGDGGSTTAKIKDVSKSALQSWLGLGNAAYTASSAYAASNHTHDASVLINNLSIGDSTPQDDDYYVSQYAGGGTTSTTYYRRPVKALWSYIKGKGDAIYQPKGSYAAASHTHTKAQVGLDNVDNTADANKSVKYATKAANADVAIGVADYNTPSKTIKIGYNGDGITGDAIKYIAGYTTGDGGSTTAKIKDVSKSALQSWLGLGNAAYTASSAYAASNHTHDDRYYTESEIDAKLKTKADTHSHPYLPLAGGTVTGVTAFTNTTASTNKSTGAVKVSGGVGVAGRMSANEVMIGDGCTLRYDATNKCVNFTFS